MSPGIDDYKLFRPGTFSFRRRKTNTVTLKLIASLTPDYQAKVFLISVLADQAKQIFEQKIAEIQGNKD